MEGRCHESHEFDNGRSMVTVGDWMSEAKAKAKKGKKLKTAQPCEQFFTQEQKAKMQAAFARLGAEEN